MPDASTSVLQRALTSEIHGKSRVMQSKAAETRNDARRERESRNDAKKREMGKRDALVTLLKSNNHRIPRETAHETRSSLHISRRFSENGLVSVFFVSFLRICWCSSGFSLSEMRDKAADGIFLVCVCFEWTCVGSGAVLLVS
jgi:hypothetical protein